MSLMTLANFSQQFSGDEWPTFVSLSSGENTYQILLRVDPSIRWFAGHFPGQPVLPGVVQTHWAACMSQYAFGLGDSFSRIENLKFQTMILPDVEITLGLEFNDQNSQVKFLYNNNDAAFSEGKLVFSP